MTPPLNQRIFCMALSFVMQERLCAEMFWRRWADIPRAKIRCALKITIFGSGCTLLAIAALIHKKSCIVCAMTAMQFHAGRSGTALMRVKSSYEREKHLAVVIGYIFKLPYQSLRGSARHGCIGISTVRDCTKSKRLLKSALGIKRCSE